MSSKIKNVPINHKHYLNNPNQSCMFLAPTNSNEVMTIIKTLKDSAAGLDGYNLKIIKAMLDFVILPITHNKSLFPNWGSSQRIKNGKSEASF